MKIGIVGAGRMGQTLAFLALRAGHRVQLSNSTPDAEFHAVLATLGSGASGGSTHDVAHFGELCFIATRWEQVPAAASECGDMTNRIVVDVTNNRFGPGAHDVYDLGDRSSSEVVAEMFPGARLVKAFNNQPITALRDVAQADPGAPPALFLAGDDPAAKSVMAQFIRDIGASPIDVGNLATGGRLMSTGGGPLAGLPRLLAEPEARALLARAGGSVALDATPP